MNRKGAAGTVCPGFRCLLQFTLPLLAAFPCLAGTVELTVRERNGPPLRGVGVVVQPPMDPEERLWATLPDRESGFGVTGADGKALVQGVPPGSYTLTFPHIGEGLIDPAENPYAPAPSFTIVRDDDRVRLVVEVWRGVAVSAQLVVDHDEAPPASLVFHSLDGLPERRVALRFGAWQGYLVPGRWEAEFEFPAGYLLSDLVLNGESLPGHAARMDITNDPRRQTLTGYLNARSLIIATIASDDPSCPARPVATLIEPAGDWIAGATERGGSEYRQVVGVYRPPCEYRIWLPEGSWIVRLEGDFAGSDPEEVPVSIALGEQRRLEFSVRTKDRNSRRQLSVRVLSPERKPIPGAVVEVYPAGAAGPGGAPLATERTRVFPPGAFFGKLARGAYRVVAGHSDYLEAEATVEDFDPAGKKPASVEIVLREGARIHAVALDEKGGPVGGIAVHVERLGEAPLAGLTCPEIRQARLSRTVLTDATGHAEVRGLAAGDYRIRGTLSGEGAATRFVRVRRGAERPVELLDVTLVDGRTTDVSLAVSPAASVAGALQCSDGGSLPPAASLRVFDATSPPSQWRDPQLRDGSALALDGVRLTGGMLDRFLAGPLEKGSFLLAVRPEGNDYWSWPSDVLMPADARSFALEELAPLETGVLPIECGPVVMLVPRIASGESCPDLRLGTLAAAAHAIEPDPPEPSVRPAGTVPSVPAEKEPILPRQVETWEDRILVRGLAPAKIQLEVRFEHPYLIPNVVRLTRDDLDLQRGRLYEIALPFEMVGGLVDVRGEGAAARRVAPDGAQELQLVVDGRALFPATPAGRYRIELCTDAACRTLTKTWNDVTVAAGRTLLLR